MLPEEIRSALMSLRSRLRMDDSPYERSLASRLDTILTFEGPDVRPLVRENVNLADWNYFQVDVNSASVMRQAYEEATESYAADLAKHFAEQLDKAVESQKAIHALLSYGWTFPLNQR
jgi:hypothetical protein